MKNFFKIFKILTPKQMRICCFIIGLMFVVSIMEAFGIGLLYPLINIIGDQNFLNGHQKVASFFAIIGIKNHRQLVCFCSIALLLFYILKNILIILQGKIQITFSIRNQNEFSKKLYSYYMNKDYLYHLNTNISIVTRNINCAGVIIFSEIFVNTFQIITNIITCFVIGIFVAFVDWFIAICIIAVIAPLIFTLLRYFRKKIGIAGDIQNKCNAENFKWIYQGFSSLKETKVMQKQTYFIDNYCKSYNEYAYSISDFLLVQRYPKSIIEMTTIGGIFLLIAIKTLISKDTSSLIPTLGVLALAAVRLMPALNQIIAMYNSIKFKMPLFNEIFDDIMIIRNLKDPVEIEDKKNEEKIVTFNEKIRVEHLCFCYPGKKKNVINDVSFDIPKGSFIGIIGPSGAGKTTFVDILLGLLPATSGKIFVDGIDISTSISSWLNYISYVPQQIYLIDGTIKENIAFGLNLSEVNENRVQQVLKMAELYDFVQTLPEKENTPVGDHGSKLSGGQRQRIGIARALYSAPKVLVLDEATSALDSETEAQITKTVLKLKGEITIIAIAHRLSTLENCDFKLKFENGKVTKC